MSLNKEKEKNKWTWGYVKRDYLFWGEKRRINKTNRASETHSAYKHTHSSSAR